MKYKLILAIFAICLTASIILSFPKDTSICKPGEGCDTVQNSKYAYTFGIKNSYLGIIVFSFLSLVTLSHIRDPKKKKHRIISGGIIVGSLIAVYFIYLQKFVIEAWCKYCLVVDFSLLIALTLIFFKK